MATHSERKQREREQRTKPTKLTDILNLLNQTSSSHRACFLISKSAGRIFDNLRQYRK